jgi:hypothetical protein
MDAQPGNRHGMCRRCFVVAIASCIAFLIFAGSALASDPGLAWLLGQQQDDGRIAASADRTTSDHATFESLRALHLLAGGATPEFVQARDFLNQNAHSGIPWLPRRLLALRLSSEDGAETLAALRAHQNPDGGFTAAMGEQSSVLDTVDALEALGAAGFADVSVLQPTIAFLLARQGSGGGYAATPQSPASVYLTARAVSALQRYRFDYGLSDAMQAATDFLWNRERQGTWGPTWESAEALLALMPTTADPARYAGALHALREDQGADGSWEQSVYATALALRTLRTAESGGLPAAPHGATIIGRVVDSHGGAPVVGVTVSVYTGQAQARTMVGGPDGRFTLADLEPQDYLLTLSSPGFQSQTRSVGLSGGQMLDLGLVPLALEPETALVHGRVRDAATGAGIGAVITVNGSSSAGTTADADGTFVASVPTGDVHLVVTAAGYRPVDAWVAIAAGDRLLFSPSLVPEDASDPEPGITVSGRLVDAETGVPVPGAVIRIVGSSTMALSDGAGAFSVARAEAGEIRIEVLHGSYQPAIVHLLTTPGDRAELGDLYLFPNPETTSTVLGVVVDRETGAPVSSAQVQADGRLTHTDAAGHFRIDGIDALEFDVSVGAIGYRTASARLVLEQPGWVRLDVALEPVSADGIRVTGLVGHQEEYGAFEDARFSAVVANEGQSDRSVVLVATVRGLANDFREDFVVPVPGASRDASFLLAPGESILSEVTWFTREVAPGTYRVTVQAWSGDRTALLSERAVQVTVAETRRINTLSVLPDPASLVRGESREVELRATVRNGSNVPTDLNVGVALRAPTGELVHQETLELSIPVSAGPLTYTLTRFSHAFDAAGAYPVEVQGLGGTPVAAVNAGRIDVSPNMRVHGSHHLEPAQILPGDGARVQIRLTIEGMEDAQ